MASKEFLRQLRKKHHLGEFRINKGSRSRKSRTKRVHHTKGGNNMVRHHRRSGKRSRGFVSGGLWKNIIGVAGYIGFEAVIEPMLAQFIPNEYLDIAELGLGAYFMNKGGIIGDVAKASVYINSYTLLKRYISPMLSMTTN